jgi:signal transduction histidine kinase
VVIPAQRNDSNVAVIHVAHDLGEERAIRTQLVTTDRLASIGRLAAGVAHEINNPAAFVTVNLGVLRDRFVAGTARTQDVLAMLDESLNGMERIREIMRDLKGLARERSIDLVDLGAVAQSALRMAAHETRGRARVERVSEEGAIARVRGARIAQVVLNLILNAAQALPAGRAENRITVRTRREGSRAVLEVIDNGSGIEPSVASLIFEPFFTTREGSGGTGLGLWLARSIVAEEGGQLTFRDAPGGGASFLVDLPAADPPAPDATDASAGGRQTDSRTS